MNSILLNTYLLFIYVQSSRTGEVPLIGHCMVKRPWWWILHLVCDSQQTYRFQGLARTLFQNRSSFIIVAFILLFYIVFLSIAVNVGWTEPVWSTFAVICRRRHLLLQKIMQDEVSPTAILHGDIVTSLVRQQ